MIASSVKQIHIHYYAVLREQRGIGEETLQTEACTVRDLYDELRAQHGFSLGVDRLSVAVNDEFATWDSVLNADDNVVFIPPVAGG